VARFTAQLSGYPIEGTERERERVRERRQREKERDKEREKEEERATRCLLRLKSAVRL